MYGQGTNFKDKYDVSGNCVGIVNENENNQSIFVPVCFI